MSAPLDDLAGYSAYVYALRERHPQVTGSTLTLAPIGATLAKLEGQIECEDGIHLAVWELVDFAARRIRERYIFANEHRPFDFQGEKPALIIARATDAHNHILAAVESQLRVFFIAAGRSIKFNHRLRIGSQDFNRDVRPLLIGFDFKRKIHFARPGSERVETTDWDVRRDVAFQFLIEQRQRIIAAARLRNDAERSKRKNK